MNFGEYTASPKIIVVSTDKDAKKFGLRGAPGTAHIAPWGQYLVVNIKKAQFLNAEKMKFAVEKDWGKKEYIYIVVDHRYNITCLPPSDLLLRGCKSCEPNRCWAAIHSRL